MNKEYYHHLTREQLDFYLERCYTYMNIALKSNDIEEIKSLLRNVLGNIEPSELPDVLIPNKLEPLEETKMNKEEAEKLKDLIFKLRTEGYDAVIFDPKKEVPKQECEVIVRGVIKCKECIYYVPEKGGFCVEGHLLTTGECEQLVLEKSQCERCFHHVQSKEYGDYCNGGRTVPIEGVNCPDFNPDFNRVEKPLPKYDQDFLEKHVDLVIRKTLIVSARDLLIKACKGTDDPLYKVYRELETDFIEHFNTHSELSNLTKLHHVHQLKDETYE